MSTGHSKILAQKAFFDTLGGYLKYYMVPTSMYSFYGGLIKLRTVETILELYDQSKTFLNTNGNGWRAPLKDFLDFDIQIEPLRIIIDQIEEDTSCMQLEMQKDSSDEPDDMIFTLPRLETEEKGILGNIWLPFKRKHTFNLRSSKSAFVLLRYFELTTRCYNFQGICQDTFNTKFKNWILENLDIHLKDDVFYPGLGATLRILKTIRSRNSDFVVIEKRHKTENYKALESRAKQLERHSKDWLKNIFGRNENLVFDDTIEGTPIQKEAEDSRRMMYIYVAIIIAALLLVLVISVAYIIKWSNSPPPPIDSDVEKTPKKEKRVRINEEFRRRSSKDDEEVLLGPDSSSIASSPSEMSKSSKPIKDISLKSVKNSSKSNCFPLCTRKNSLEFEKTISSMESDSSNENSDKPICSKFVDSSKTRKLEVVNDRK